MNTKLSITLFALLSLNATAITISGTIAENSANTIETVVESTDTLTSHTSNFTSEEATVDTEEIEEEYDGVTDQNLRTDNSDDSAIFTAITQTTQDAEEQLRNNSNEGMSRGHLTYTFTVPSSGIDPILGEAIVPIVVSPPPTATANRIVCYNGTERSPDAYDQNSVGMFANIAYDITNSANIVIASGVFDYAYIVDFNNYNCNESLNPPV